MLPLVLAVLAAAVTVEADLSAANFFFNITVPVVSGLFGKDTLGWNSSWSESPWSEYQSGMIGLGESQAFVEYDYPYFVKDPSTGPRLASLLTAKAIWVEGSWTPRNTTITDPAKGLALSTWSWNAKSTDGGRVDYTDVAPPSYARDGIIMSVSDMPYRTYRFGFGTTRLTNGADLFLKTVTFTTGIQIIGKPDNFTLDQVEQTVIPFVDGDAINGNYSCDKGWRVSHSLGGGIAGQTAAEIDTLRADFGINPDALCRFQIPQGTSMIMLNGTMGPNYNGLRISFDRAVEGPQELGPTTVSSFIVPNTVLYMTPLDPASIYTVSFKGKGEQFAGLHSMTLFSSTPKSLASTETGKNTSTPDAGATATNGSGASPQATTGGDTGSSHQSSSSSSHGLSGGAIAGIVVGVILSLVLLAIVITACILAKRKNQHRSKLHDEPRDFVDATDVAATPFPLKTTTNLRNSMSQQGFPTPVSMQNSSPFTADGYTTSSGASALDVTADGGMTPLATISANSKTPAATSRSPVRAVSEQDSEDVELVPPQYNPKWQAPRGD